MFFIRLQTAPPSCTRKIRGKPSHKPGRSEDDRTTHGFFFNLILQLSDEIEEPQVRNYVSQFLEGY